MEKSECKYERYFQLLMLVKMDSSANYLWVSFVEGLHRHAATILALLCTKFDHEKKILPGSLSIQDFKDAKIPHFVDPKISPQDLIKQRKNSSNTCFFENVIPRPAGSLMPSGSSTLKRTEC
jgi:hypothetical protein